MVAVVASAVLAFLGNQNRQRMEVAVTRHFEMVGNLDELLILLLNAETGLRGHLLTEGTEYLQPFADAQQALPKKMEELRRFVEAEPGAQPRQQKRTQIEGVRATIDEEMSVLTRLRDSRTVKPEQANLETALVSQLVQSKTLMDGLRGQLRTMQTEERRLLDQRLTEISQVRRRDYLSISAALLLGLLTRGLAFWLFHRRVVRRIENLSDNVRGLSAGEPLPHPVSGNHDTIGEMERELDDAAARRSRPSSS